MCRSNCFRSKVAESYFKKINKIKKIKVKSLGLVGGATQNKNQIKIAKEFGINIKGKPVGLNPDILKWANLVVIVADDVPKNISKNKKTIKWYIKDVKSANDNKDVERAIKEVMKKVDKLVKDLEARK